MSHRFRFDSLATVKTTREESGNWEDHTAAGKIGHTEAALVGESPCGGDLYISTDKPAVVAEVTL